MLRSFPTINAFGSMNESDRSEHQAALSPVHD
jgi:hypothetical protein